jgi:hypothetical protein
LREVSVVGNSEGNKVTETIFTGSREFIMLVDSGEIISQSPEPRSVSGAGLHTYRVCPPSPLQNAVTVTGNCRASWRLATLQS